MIEQVNGKLMKIVPEGRRHAIMQILAERGPKTANYLYLKTVPGVLAMEQEERKRSMGTSNWDFLETMIDDSVLHRTPYRNRAGQPVTRTYKNRNVVHRLIGLSRYGMSILKRLDEGNEVVFHLMKKDKIK
jgi:hypothetical protein